ncbi:DUF4035 domain-containing protein [Cupriavidus sp. YAF13]
MAFYELEPWGSHYDDLRAGAVTSMLANINRNTKAAPKPFGVLDFMPWNDHHQHVAEEGDAAMAAIMADPEAHSRLLDSTMFPGRA